MMGCMGRVVATGKARCACVLAICIALCASSASAAPRANPVRAIPHLDDAEVARLQRSVDALIREFEETRSLKELLRYTKAIKMTEKRRNQARETLRARARLAVVLTLLRADLKARDPHLAGVERVLPEEIRNYRDVLNGMASRMKASLLYDIADGVLRASAHAVQMAKLAVTLHRDWRAAIADVEPGVLIDDPGRDLEPPVDAYEVEPIRYGDDTEEEPPRYRPEDPSDGVRGRR
jgi:hypothetical protein